MNDTKNRYTQILETSTPQRTLRADFRITGTGIFCGKETGFTAKPSEPDTGIVFHVGDEKIPANIDYVEEAMNRTVLKKGEHEVHVVEHLVSALKGMGVDNALIEVDTDEIPIIDASSLKYVRAILETGVIEQDAIRKELVILKPIYVETDDAFLAILPDCTARISYYLDHPHPRIGQVSDSLILSVDTYRDFIGPARTFATKEEAEYLIRNNVVGTDDESLAIVVDDNGPNHELRNEKEYVHHKMLDMIGDLSLAFWPIRGHLTGTKSGHVMNRQLARRLKSLSMNPPF